MWQVIERSKALLFRDISYGEEVGQGSGAGRPLADRSQGSSCRLHRSDFFFGSFFHVQAKAREQLIDAEAIKQGVEDIKNQHYAQ